MSRGKLTIVIAAVVAAAVIAGLAISSNKETNNQNTTTPQSNQTQSQNQNNSSNTPSSTDKISIANMAFSPSSITVKKGTTVTWTNNDSLTHNVKATDGKNGPNSDDLANGQSYSFTFNETGTFSYNCSIHPQMTGTVTVTE